MKPHAFLVLAIILGPTALAYFSGHVAAAHYLGLGSILALQLALLARPVAAFSILIPAVYAAAAITAQSTDGVVALVVAIAAAVGASSSQGLHRGLVALLAAALLGSFEPGPAADVMWRAGFLLAGSTYGFLVGITMLRHVHLEARSVHPQGALGYAALLAVLALLAWFAARIGDFAHNWWLPLAVVAVSEPVVTGSLRQSMARVALGLAASALLIGISDAFDPPLIRGILLVGMLLVAFSLDRSRRWALSLLLAPVLVLLSSHGAPHESALVYGLSFLPAFLPVLVATCLGHFVLWVLQPASGRVAA